MNVLRSLPALHSGWNQSGQLFPCKNDRHRGPEGSRVRGKERAIQIDDSCENYDKCQSFVSTFCAHINSYQKYGHQKNTGSGTASSHHSSMFLSDVPLHSCISTNHSHVVLLLFRFRPMTRHPGMVTRYPRWWSFV